MGYTGRERIRRALDHKESDRTPFDLGGSVVTSISKSVYTDLVAKLGLPKRPTITDNLYSQTAVLNEDVLEALNVDVRPARMGINTFEEDVLTQKDDIVYFSDSWGFKYVKEVDSKGGFELENHPLAEISDAAALDKLDWPSGRDKNSLIGLKESCEQSVNSTQKGVIIECNSPGVFELACWLKGTENFYIDMVTNESFALALIERIVQYKLEYWEDALQYAGAYVDIARESDDLGSQTSLLISPEMYRKFIMPAHKRIFDFIRRKSTAAVSLHSCGAIKEIIPDLIEIGVDVLNPVQVSAVGMEPEGLKSEFGKDLVFWGGSICSQTQLVSESPERVTEIVKRNIDLLGQDGGFILAPINMIQHDVPAENIIALAKAIL